MRRRITHIPFFISAVLVLFIIIPIGSVIAYLRYDKYLADESRIRRYYSEEVKKVLDANIANSTMWFDFRLRDMEEKAKLVLKAQNEAALSFIEGMHQKGALKKRSLYRDILRRVRYFGNGGYFFAIRMDGVVDVYPPDPAIEGRNLNHLKKPGTDQSLKDILGLLKKKKSSYFTYNWYEKGKKTHKISYVKFSKELDWVVGTGFPISVLMDDLKKNIVKTVATWRSDLGDFFIVLDDDANVIAGKLPDVLESNRGRWEKKVLEMGKRLKEEYLDFSFSKRTQLPEVTMRSRYFNKMGYTIVTGLNNEDFERFIYSKKMKLRDGIEQTIVLFIFSLIIGSGIVYYISQHFKKQIETSFNVFSDFFERARSEYTPINRSDLRFHEFRKLAACANDMTNERIRKDSIIKEFTRKLREANHKLKNMAHVDGLTKIANRRRFDSVFRDEWSRALRSKSILTLCLIDIDFFKKYNDTYGHQSGDECLFLFATELKKVIKRPSDFLARYGGEEFVVLLPGTDVEGALIVAEEMREAVEKLNLENEGSLVSDIVTFSMGIASVVPEKEMGKKELIEMADKALYRAKEEGRNRSCIFTE